MKSVTTLPVETDSQKRGWGKKNNQSMGPL